MDPTELMKMIEPTLKDLEQTKLIKMDSNGDFRATLLDQAITASSLTPEDGLFVHRGL